MIKTKVIGLIILALSLCYGLVHADTSLLCNNCTALHGEWGIGLDGDSTKYLSIGARGKLSNVWEQGGEIGMWFDKRSNASNAGFVSYLFGLEPKYDGFYIHYFVGPSYITLTDSYLSTNLEITHEAGIGFKDKRGVRLGIDYRHWSNAGIKEPNEGRDFIAFQMEIPL